MIIRPVCQIFVPAFHPLGRGTVEHGLNCGTTNGTAVEQNH
jgi:hypothetical protein